MEGLPVASTSGFGRGAQPAARAGSRGGGGQLSRGRRAVLWRHGQTTWNHDGRFQGQLDISLDDTGLAQAERAARLLAGLRPAAIVSSDLIRASDTAAALARVTGLSVTVDKDLRERYGGEWEGLTVAEIRERYPAEHANWSPPGGESSPVVAERVAGAVTRAMEQIQDRALLAVVGHGAALRLGAAHLLGLPESLWRVLGPLSNCSWILLGESGDGSWRLLEHNAGTLPEPVLGDDS